MADDLFTGVEDSETRTSTTGDDPVAPGPAESLGGMANSMLKEWWSHLTYHEVHAFIIGFTPWFLFLVTGHPALLAVGVGVTLAAFGLRKVENRALRVVVREPWYCLGGSTLGWMVGASALATARLVGVLVGTVP